MELFEALKGYWQNTPGPIRTFAVAVPSALFGAWVSGRGQARRAVIEEVRLLGAAHALCFNIANKALALKRQHIQRMKIEYDAATDAHDVAMATGADSHIVTMNFHTLLAPSFPSAALEKIILEKTNIGTVGISTAIALTGAIDDLKGSFDYRTALAEEFRKNAGDPLPLRVARYLGLFFNNFVDDRFRNNIEALLSHTDDCIFFAVKMSTLVVKYENKLRRRRWHFYLPGRRLIEPNWQRAHDAQLIPSDEEYIEWTRGFEKRPNVVKRIKAWFATR
jgi:hypothetical protein